MKNILYLLLLILLLSSCAKTKEEAEPTTAEEVEPTQVEEVEPSPVEKESLIQEEPEKKDPFLLALEILKSHPDVLAKEFEVGGYIQPFEENQVMELDGKKLIRIDYVENREDRLHVSERYAVDIDTKDIYIQDIIQGGDWVPLS